MIWFSERYPNGEGSIKKILEWIDNVQTTIEDGTIVWDEMIPLIKDALKYEFSEANPNNWAPLRKKYVDWKRRKGYPDTIGVMTEALKKSLTERGISEAQKNLLKWKSDPTVEGYKKRKVGTYAQYFDDKRKVFKFTKQYLRKNVIEKISAAWREKWHVKNQ
jgi:hypothetical protein